jgi:hypothetical protein
LVQIKIKDMIQNNEGLNTSRLVGNNGQVFIEDTSEHLASTYFGTGAGFFGFAPHSDGCKLEAITITNADGDTIDETDTAWATLTGTTADLKDWVSAGLVNKKKGYITAITLASGACTLYADTISRS